MPPQGFLQELQRGLLVTRLLHEAFVHLTFVVDGASEVVMVSVDLHKDLVEGPPPVAQPHALSQPLSDFRHRHRSDPVPPELRYAQPCQRCALGKLCKRTTNGRKRPVAQADAQQQHLTKAADKA